MNQSSSDCQISIQSENEKDDLLEKCLKFKRDREKSNERLNTKSIIYESNSSLSFVEMRNVYDLSIELSFILRNLRTITSIENLLMIVHICYVHSIKLHALHALNSRVRRNKAVSCSSTLSISIFV